MPEINKHDIEGLIDNQIKNIEVYKSAFTHRSYLNEHRNYGLPHNERLEFLGDAVLELAATEHLYRNYPHSEGELTNFRSALVNYKKLSEIAKSIGLENYMLMSRGESKDTGRARAVILANAIEAFIGAIYLDLGYEAASKFIDKHILVELPNIISGGSYVDPKSKLQEVVQEKRGITPTYRVISESGPDHAKHFIVGAYVGEDLVGQGEGPSKQEAESAAAENSLKISIF